MGQGMYLSERHLQTAPRALVLNAVRALCTIQYDWIKHVRSALHC